MNTEDKLKRMYIAVYGEPSKSCKLEIQYDDCGGVVGVCLMKDGAAIERWHLGKLTFAYVTRDWVDEPALTVDDRLVELRAGRVDTISVSLGGMDELGVPAGVFCMGEGLMFTGIRDSAYTFQLAACVEQPLPEVIPPLSERVHQLKCGVVYTIRVRQDELMMSARTFARKNNLILHDHEEEGDDTVWVFRKATVGELRLRGILV